jgi:hypothetical protein
MKKKNDFKRKNSLPEPDDHEEKRAAIPPAGDIQQEIREMRQAMINVRYLPVERHHPVPPEAIPDTIEELFQRLKRLEMRLERLEQRAAATPAANPFDLDSMKEMKPVFIGLTVLFVVVWVFLAGC